MQLMEQGSYQIYHQNGEIYGLLFFQVEKPFKSSSQKAVLLGIAPHHFLLTFSVSPKTEETDAQELKKLMKVSDASARDGRHRKGASTFRKDGLKSSPGHHFSSLGAEGCRDAAWRCRTWRCQ